MRHLKWLTLIAFAVACNKEETDTNDSDTDTGDTQTTVLSLDSGTTTYAVKVDSATVCSSSYSITGTEYTNGMCDNCDFMFSVATTETANTDTTACPNRDPWRFTLAVPYPAAYPDDRAGIGYVAGQWYYAGYGYIPIEKMFFSFYHTDATVYGYAIMSGTIYPGTAEETVVPGTFTNTDGDIAWTYNPDAAFSPRGAFVRNCSDRASAAGGNYLGAVANIEPNRYNDDTGATTDDWKDFVTAADDTEAGSFQCSPAEYTDSFTVSVAAAATLSVSVDVATAGNAFDPYIWINDASGCTVAVADDQFNCAAGTCDDAADTSTDPYSCCPSTQVTNSGGSAATYTIYVWNSNVDACKDTTTSHAGNYTLKIQGGTALTVAGDNLHPSYELDASGTGSITETTN